jgi:hypothetical protein
LILSTLDNSYLPGIDPRTPRVAFLCGLVGMILLAAAAYSFWPGSGTSAPEGSETHGIAVVSRSASAVGTAPALAPSLEIDPVVVAEHPAPAAAETASLSPADSVEQQSMHALAHIARSAGQGQSSPYPAFDTQKDLVIGPFVAPSAIPVETSEAKASAPIGQVAEHDGVEEGADKPCLDKKENKKCSFFYINPLFRRRIASPIGLSRYQGLKGFNLMENWG